MSQSIRKASRRADLNLHTKEVQVSAVSKAKDILTKEQLAALGEIAVESAHLEGTVDRMIRVVLRIEPDEFDILIGSRMLGRKIDVLKTCGLVRLAGKKRKRRRYRFTVLMDRIKQLISQRAIAIHGDWGPEGGISLGDLMAGKWVPGTAEAKLKKSAMKSGELEKLADAFNEADIELWKFAGENWLFRAMKTHP
jgi:hypothetical protein